MGVICKYYQQGRCRFGNDCKFQHSDVYDDGGSNRGGRLGDQYHYFKQDKPDVNVILQAVQQEIITSEKGKQWPLSCFAPMKEYGNIAGWEDISAEELRWQIYLSRQSGNLDECIKQIQELHHKAKINKNAMLNPTLESYSILESIFTKDASSLSFGQTESPTQNAFASGAFAPAAGTNAFGSAATGHSSSIFGSSAASTPAQPSPFFATPAAATSALSRNVFGNVPTVSPASVFGGAQSPASPFGGAPSPASVFGGASSTASVFGGAPSSANLFGGAPSPGSAFGGASSAMSVFGGAASPASVFGGAGAHSASIFGGQPAQPAGQTMFGNTAQQQTSLFQGSSQATAFGNANAGRFGSDENTTIAGDTYTPLTELSEDTLALFKADKYVMGKIPTLPPPRELCFS